MSDDYRDLREMIFRKYDQIESLMDRIEKRIDQRDKEIILHVQTEFNRSIMALKEHLEATKPMKTNNWDSVREAFKVPTRIEINERT